MVARKVNGIWYVDAWIDIPGNGRERLRKRSPIQTKRGAERYEAELVEHALFLSSDEPEREERRFDEFAVEFLERHVRVQCKWSTLVTYESALREHLVPFFGSQTLSSINESQ